MAPSRAPFGACSDPLGKVETPCLTLRCVRASDAAATAAMMTPAVSRWTGSWSSPITEAMALERIGEARAAAAAGTALPFAVVRRLDGLLMGWVRVTRDAARSSLGSLGYWFGEEHHGRGHPKEAAVAAVGEAFEVLGLEVMEAGAQPGNAASFAVMRACGMSPVGERAVFASARGRDEMCLFHEVRRPARYGRTPTPV